MRVFITVHAEPVGKGRPRITKNGNYTPDRTRAYEELVRLEYRKQARLRGGVWFADRAVAVRITAYYKTPKSASRTRREAMTLLDVLPVRRPDVDNVSKLILDALNGVAWVDDAQVAVLHVAKVYSVDPRVEIMITDEEVGKYG